MTANDALTLSALVQAMVRVDTRNGVMTGRAHAERDLALYLETLARSWGLATQRLAVGGGDFELLVSVPASTTAPWLLFESHLDTVGVEGMTVAPFGGEIAEGRLWGRGACDTKASGAAMLWALRRYAQANVRPNNVALLYSVDEEATKAGVIAYVRDHLPALGWRPAGAIVGEPTELKPVVAHCGVVRWAIRTHGLAAHSSDPSRGRSAISMMMRVVDALESRYIPALSASHPLVGRAQCSINIIHGGTQSNVIPDLCEVWVDRRLAPGEDPTQVLPAVTAVLEDLRAVYPTLAYSLTEPYMDAPLDPAGGEAFAAWVQAALRAQGLPPALCGAGYGTDASTLAAAGIPAVVLGPGHIAQAHTRDEWLDLSQLDPAVELYLALMQSGMVHG